MTKNIAALLNQHLAARHAGVIRFVIQQAEALDLPVYLVGGFVRDALLGRSTTDFDIVVEGNAIPLVRALVRTHGGRATTHPAFHTATWTLPPNLTPDTIDLISARSETYAHPAALPTVTFGGLPDDLLRRDFTINAMAIRLDGGRYGELVDPHNGQGDLKQKTIRVLHPRSFIDDPTRIFRAIRYAGRLGFHLSPETSALIPTALRYVDKLSPERLRNELDLILAEEHPAAMLASLADAGVLSAVKPALPAFPASHAKWLRRVPPVNYGLDEDVSHLPYLLWFMDMDDESAKTLPERLYFTAGLARILRSTLRLVRHLPEWKDAKPIEWTERLDKYPLIAVYAVHLVHHQPQLKTYLESWRHIKPAITGDDLKTFGLTPGPAFKRILSLLRSAWLEGDVKNAREERVLLELLIKSK